MKRFMALVLSVSMAISSFAFNAFANDRLVAFPGAEGGGRFTTGGRGGEVYVVTTLADYDPEKEEPIKGSLRDALSEDNRIVVFDVGGVIRLKTRLNVTKRKNITIAGQTAPGNGITIYGYETNLSNSENIIMRYLRFRPGAENVLSGDSMDSIWGRAMKDLMIDHLSCSWSTDETMSLYRAENATIQWCIVAESLTMSGHTKGRHGYGAITGGVNATYHHNLYANHTSRNPRFGGGTVEADDNDHIALFDFRNNVIYNWGYNTGYGGGRGKSNYVYNYMKPGPGTRSTVVDRIFDCGEKNKPGWFYVNGNVLEGNADVTADNSKGIYISDENKPFTTIVDSEFAMEGTKAENLHTDTPEDAYSLVLKRAGATYPLRDGLDGGIIQSVRDNTGYFVNRHEELGGLPYTDEVHRPQNFDKDKDGIADQWELANGLNPSDSTDSSKIASNGYANIENYFNSLVDMDYEPTNSDVTITSPVNNQQFNVGENVNVAIDAADDVKKADFYINDELVATDSTKPFAATIKNLNEGIYNINVKACNSKGEWTQPLPNKIYINATEGTGTWQSIDIGSVPLKGSASLNNGTLVVKGSGKLKGREDSCHYVYKSIKGDFDFTVKADNITPVDNHAFSGIMARTSTDANSPAVALGISHTKAYEWKEVNPDTGKKVSYYRNPFSVYMCNRNNGGEMDTLSENLDSPEKAAKSGVQLLNDIPFKDGEAFKGTYLRLVRKGDKFVAYTSSDGSGWKFVGQNTVPLGETCLIGVAVDGNKADNAISNMNRAEFSHLTFK